MCTIAAGITDDIPPHEWVDHPRKKNAIAPIFVGQTQLSDKLSTSHERILPLPSPVNGLFCVLSEYSSQAEVV